MSLTGIDKTALFFMSPRQREFLSGQLNEPYREHWGLYAVVNALARNIMQVPWQIKRGREKSAEVVELGQPGGEWVALFDQPNPNLVGTQLWEAIIVWLSLSGECMLVKLSRDDRPVNPGEVPAELWPFDGKLFYPIFDKQTQTVKGWTYRPSIGAGEPVVYLPHEVAHVKYYNPYEPLRGLAPWEAAQYSVRGDVKAQRYNEAFLDNDATPGLVLFTQGELSPDQRSEIKEAWDDRHRGFAKRRRTAILEGGLDVKDIGSTHREMEFTKLRETAFSELLAIYKVPKTEVALHENLNFATAQSVDRGFWTKTLIPIQKLIESHLWGQLFRDVDGGQYFGEFDRASIESLRDNLESKLASAERMQRLGYTLNQINERLDLGMEEVAWGDMPLAPAGLQPLESVEAQADAGTEPAPNAEPNPTPEGPSAEDLANIGAAAPTLTDEERVEVYRTVTAFLRARSPKKEAAWKAVVKATIDPYEQKFAGRFRRFTMELQAEQLRLLNQSGLGGRAAEAPAIRAELDGALFDKKKWTNRLGELQRPIYFDVTRDAAEQVFGELGGNFAFDVTDPAVVDLVHKREVKLQNVTDTIRRQTRRQLETGVEKGESLQQLADRLRATFNFARSRALVIARTEVAGATNSARYAAMDAEGVDQHEWVTAHDEVVRESHRLAEEQGPVALGATFGNGLKYPNDPDGAPGEVINCRCVALPV